MAKILIMDDDQPLLSNMAEFLRLHGHEVSTAVDGADAMNRLLDAPHDLLITDILVQPYGQSHDRGGALLLGRLQHRARGGGFVARPWLAGLRIIAMSGGPSIPGGFDILQMAKTLGADACLGKPIPPETLLAEINHQLSSIETVPQN